MGSPEFVVISKQHILDEEGITDSRTVVPNTVCTINPGEPSHEVSRPKKEGLKSSLRTYFIVGNHEVSRPKKEGLKSSLRTYFIVVGSRNFSFRKKPD